MAFSNTIENIFDFIPETNIIEEDFYDHKGIYPVYSGQTENEGIVGKLDSFNQESPCITTTTYGVGAGKLFYREGKYTIGRNCMGLRPKEEYINKINLKWFTFSFQNVFYKYRIGDESGQRSLNRLLLKNVLIFIPDPYIQEKQLIAYEKLSGLRKIINLKIDHIIKAISFRKIYSKDKIIARDKINEFFDIAGGNSGLTEEFMYYNLPESKEDKIEILTASTTSLTAMGYISENSRINNKPIKIFSGPAILIVRKGLAGHMTFINNRKFTTNDDAYVLIPKETWKDKINLGWFMNEYQELFWNITTSKSDNATFSKEYAEKQVVEIPEIREQNRIIGKMLPLKRLLLELEKIAFKIKSLLEYSIEF